MSTTVQIKRSTFTGNLHTYKAGELAFLPLSLPGSDQTSMTFAAARPMNVPFS